MLRLLVTALCLMLMSVSNVAIAAEAAPAGPDQIANTAFSLIKEGKSREAINETLGRSPVMAKRIIETEPLAAQIDSAVRIYGPVRSYEQVAEKKIGTLLIRRSYLVQHEMMLTRWQLDFGRLPTGWALLNISFDDQVKNWDAN